VAGHPEDAHVAYHVVSPDYFKTLRIPLRRGRAFTATDRGGSLPVVIMNETAARTIWGAADPLTTPVMYGDRPVQVVGVVADVHSEDIASPPKPAMFVPFGQSSRSRGTLFVRTACGTAGCDPTTLTAAVRREVRAADRNHSVSDVKTMEERLYDAAARDRVSTRISSPFAP